MSDPIDNHPIDEQALDEYLNRGSVVSRRYRELDALDVPAELDRRVLDEARAAVVLRATHRSRRWMRWSAPVALAASVVLVLSIVVRSGVQQTTQSLSPAPRVTSESLARTEADPARREAISSAEQERRQASGKAANAPQSEPPRFGPTVPVEAPSLAVEALPEPYLLREEPATHSVGPQAPAAVTAPEDVAAKTAPDSAASASAAESAAQFAPAPEPAPAQQSAVTADEEIATAVVTAQGARNDSKTDLSEVAVTGSRVPRPRSNAGPPGTISAARAESRGQSGDSTADTIISEPQHADPERWLKEIRDLRKGGKSELADREWARFREAFPNHHVAEDDPARGQPTPQSQAPHER